MANGPGKGTDHHRKPSSIGGERTRRNMVRVPRCKHAAWHTLFSNLEAPEILMSFQNLNNVFSANPAEISPRLLDALSKKQAAWELLFRKSDRTMMSLEEMFTEINTTWLDPDYKFMVTEHGALRCIYRPAA